MVDGFVVTSPTSSMMPFGKWTLSEPGASAERLSSPQHLCLIVLVTLEKRKTPPLSLLQFDILFLDTLLRLIFSCAEQHIFRSRGFFRTLGLCEMSCDKPFYVFVSVFSSHFKSLSTSAV